MASTCVGCPCPSVHQKRNPDLHAHRSPTPEDQNSITDQLPENPTHPPLIEYIFHEEEVADTTDLNLILWIVRCLISNHNSVFGESRGWNQFPRSSWIINRRTVVHIFQFEQCVMIAHYFPDKTEYLWAVKRAKIVSFQEFLDDPGFLFGVI